jgi:preprotein translocase subunit SecD
MKRALVLLMGVLAGCGGGGAADKGQPAHNRVELVYVAPSMVGAQQAAPVMASRLRRLDLGKTTVQPSGRKIVVSVPDRGAADRARALLASRGALAFYDWEPDVIGADCRPHPRDAQTTGGPSAGQPGAASLAWSDAMRRAKRCHGRAVMAEYDAVPSDPRTAQWFVLRGRPALTSTDIVDPNNETDSSGEAIVTLDFTPSGARAWKRVTRRIARRGQESVLPGYDPRDVFQHFAVVLDDRLLSVPYIDFQANPDGIDATNGSQISGGFTPQSAENLAAALASGPLPVTVRLVKQP